MEDPAKIYQENLDAVSAALMEGDGARCLAHMALPILMRTTGSEVLIETPEDLISDIEKHGVSLKGFGVTHYIRLVKKAAYLREDIIEGWHETHMLRGAQIVLPRYMSRLILRQIDGPWKVIEAEHELAGERFPGGVVKPVPGFYQDRWRAGFDDIRAGQAKAEPIYQTVLDAMSESVVDGDFERWCSLFTWPHEIHFDATDHVAEKPEDVRGFYDKVRDILSDRGADALPRRAKRADFVSGDRIVGYHDTTMSAQGRTVYGPIQSRMMMTLQDRKWRCMSVTNAISNKQLSEVTAVTESLPTMRQIQERMRNG